MIEAHRRKRWAFHSRNARPYLKGETRGLQLFRLSQSHICPHKEHFYEKEQDISIRVERACFS